MTTRTPSIAENLRHLEMHITDYMHEHADDGETLYVQPKGFRFPYKATLETLDENMKYLEMMLEEFLHDHETTTTTSEEVANIVIDDEANLHTGTIPGAGDAPGAGQYFWSNAGHPQEQVSTANPRVGSKHIRSSISGNTNADIFCCDPTVSEVNNPRFAVTGNTAVASVWARQDPAQGHAVTFEFLFENAAGNSIGFNDDNVIGTLTTEYQLFETAEVTLPTGTAFLSVQMRTPFTSGKTYVVDWDTFAINATTEVESDLTLYTNQVGFRFPHPWKEEWAIKENVKHLEDQISRWLHRHVVDF